MKHLTIRARVILGFAVVFTFLVALSGIGLQRVGAINAGLTTINDVLGQKQRFAINKRGSVHDQAIAVRDSVLYAEQAQIDAAIEDIRRLQADYIVAEAGLAEMLADRSLLRPGEQEIVDALNAVAQEGKLLMERVIALEDAGDKVAASALVLERVTVLYTEWLARINAYIDFNEAIQAETTTATRAVGDGFVGVMLAATGLALLIGGGLAVWIVRAIARLTPVTTAMRRLAEGEIDAATPEPIGADEVADIARALRVFQANAREMAALTAEREGQAQRNAEMIKAEMAKLADGMEAQVRQSLATARAQADKMRMATETVLAAMASVTEEAGSAATSSEHMNPEVGAVAAAAEELATSISTIADQAARSTDIAAGAVGASETTTVAVSGLAERSQRIGDVVQLIDDIAEQTNLLALNATIEAARAGDAGRGFAVVANEVKSLAGQTSSATGDIGQQVSDIQGSVSEAVGAIHAIGGSISEVDKAARAIAGAVGEQGRATGEISASAQRAAMETSAVSSQISSMSAAASEADQAARAAADTAAHMADEMTGLERR
ncbi:MAG: methyl-accepting chemotaxis protein, partial [Pseudomonadota bacterium]